MLLLLLSLQLSSVRMRVTSLEGELNQAKALQESVEKDFNRLSGELAAVSAAHTAAGLLAQGPGGRMLRVRRSCVEAASGPHPRWTQLARVLAGWVAVCERCLHVCCGVPATLSSALQAQRGMHA